jgi:hypothetical protein
MPFCLRTASRSGTAPCGSGLGAPDVLRHQHQVIVKRRGERFRGKVPPADQVTDGRQQRPRFGQGVGGDDAERGAERSFRFVVGERGGLQIRWTFTRARYRTSAVVSGRVARNLLGGDPGKARTLGGFGVGRRVRQRFLQAVTLVLFFAALRVELRLAERARRFALPVLADAPPVGLARAVREQADVPELVVVVFDVGQHVPRFFHRRRIRCPLLSSFPESSLRCVVARGVRRLCP